MKARISKWILTESAIKNTEYISLDYTSKLPQKETHRESLTTQTFKTDEEGAEDETKTKTKTKEAMSLQKSITLEDQHQSEEIKYAMENMEKTNQHIKRLIMEINYLHSQTPETETGSQIIVRGTGNVKKGVTGLLENIEQKDIFRVNSNVFKHGIITKDGNNMKQGVTDEKKELLKSKTKKRRKELDQRLEKTLRERDKLKMLRIKLKWQKEELADEKQMSIKKRATLIQVYREHEKQSLEKQEVISIREHAEMAHQSSTVTDSIVDLQNITQKIHVHMEIIKKEVGILEPVSVHLWTQIEDLKVINAENRAVRDNINRIKSQIIMDFERITIPAKAKTNEMVQNRDDIKKQQQKLEIALEKVKREKREMEVLNSELEIKKRENKHMIQKGIRIEGKVKAIKLI
ncbi:golgin subfamily A member 6-like protein 6 [Micropterus dolomieu]|uniref:golgin subfamily A member 6-like protein 6 n=1 Tax=Micropterus dolomieu TaxID=147949 RepID=UPI001E8E13BD|nr:golgin subfamily A member 6-like protein 6 [Micropterus dolomieu]